MLLSHLPAQLSAWVSSLVAALDKRSAPRLALLLTGALFAVGRRTVTSWLRAADIRDDFRRAYSVLFSAGRRSVGVATQLLIFVLKPLIRLVSGDRLLFAI